jgi:hypothetical protein
MSLSEAIEYDEEHDAKSARVRRSPREGVVDERERRRVTENLDKFEPVWK